MPAIAFKDGLGRSGRGGLLSAIVLASVACGGAASTPTTGATNVSQPLTDAAPPRLSFVVDRQVLLVGQTPFVELAEYGAHRNEIGPLMTRFRVISARGEPLPQRCDTGRRPHVWTLLATMTLSFECTPFDAPGPSMVRVNPAELHVRGPVIELPLRHLREPLPPGETPRGWVSIPVEAHPMDPECDRLADQGYSYAATVQSGAVELGPHRPAPPALPDTIKRIASNDSRFITAVIDVQDGWIVGSDRGEFGGGLFWVARTGSVWRELHAGSRDAPQNVVRAMRLGDKVYALEGLWHAFSSRGHLVEGWRAQSGWRARALAVFPTAPVDWVHNDDDSWLVATSTDVSRVSRKGEREILAYIPSGIVADSLVRAPDGTLYLGARAGVLRLTPTWPEAPRYRAELLVPEGSRQRACFEAPGPMRM